MRAEARDSPKAVGGPAPAALAVSEGFWNTVSNADKEASSVVVPTTSARLCEAPPLDAKNSVPDRPTGNVDSTPALKSGTPTGSSEGGRRRTAEIE